MNTFILFWNPSISNVEDEGRTEFVEGLKAGCGYDANWAVWDWKKAKEGDRFFRVMCGNPDPEKNGIIESGIFFSDPYLGDDWSGKGREVHYCDLEYDVVLDYNHVNPLTSKFLSESFWGFDWSGGHSGRMLNPEDAENLDEVWEKHLMKELLIDRKLEHAYLDENMRNRLGLEDENDEFILKENNRIKGVKIR